MTLDGDFSLVSLIWARNQMCLNWKCGKSCGHRFHASWLSKLWILEVSETEPSGTSSSQEVNFTINLAVWSSYALRPDTLPFRGIQNLHKLETSFFWAVFYQDTRKDAGGWWFFVVFFFAPRNSAMIFSTQHPHRWIFFANIRLCGRIMWCRIGRSESTDSQRSWSGAGRGVVVRPKRHKNDKFSEWILISGIAWFFKLFVELQ